MRNTACPTVVNCDIKNYLENSGVILSNSVPIQQNCGDTGSVTQSDIVIPVGGGGAAGAGSTSAIPKLTSRSFLIITLIMVITVALVLAIMSGAAGTAGTAGSSAESAGDMLGGAAAGAAIDSINAPQSMSRYI
jgi:hypothetical protein